MLKQNTGTWSHSSWFFGAILEVLPAPTDILQTNCGTNYLRSAQSPQVKGWVLHKTTLILMPVRHQGSPGYLHFQLAGYTFRGSHKPLRLADLLDWLTELRKVLCLLLQFCYKGYRSGLVKWRDTRPRSGKFLNTEHPCPLPKGSGQVTLLAHQRIYLSGSSTEIQCPECLLGFPYIGRID